MAEAQHSKSGLPKINIEQIVMPIFKTVISLGGELWYGFRKKAIPWSACFSVGSILGVFLILGWDKFLLAHTRFEFLYPTGPILYRIYVSIVLLSGLLGWAFISLIKKRGISKRLTEACLDSGLKNLRGKLPGIVYDFPIDSFTRRLRLTRANLSKAQFERAKPQLESALQVYIDEMKENREEGTIDILYSQVQMPSEIKHSCIEKMPGFKIMIGQTRAQRVEITLDDVPHLLVAGQSGGGKSTFLRQLIATLFLNNKDIELTLIDLKGGLEFQVFERLERVRVISRLDDALRALERVAGSLEKRMALLKLNNCKDIAAFQKIELEKRKYPESWSKLDNFKRHVVVIDEAFDLFRVSAGTQAKEVAKARVASNTVAQKGRAVGVHLVVATQRPDKNAVDPQTKANLSGRVCFQMSNNASSMTILDNGRATDLPAIPGRAIWQTGLDCIEVQTPNLIVAEAEKLLAPHRTEEVVPTKESKECLTPNATDECNFVDPEEGGENGEI